MRSPGYEPQSGWWDEPPWDFSLTQHDSTTNQSQ
jgi:hypothetical protein